MELFRLREQNPYWEGENIEKGFYIRLLPTFPFEIGNPVEKKVKLK